MEVDHNLAEHLLPEVERVIAAYARVADPGAVRVELGIDGSMFVSVRRPDRAVRLRWEEERGQSSPGEVIVQEGLGVVRPVDPHPPPETQSTCRQVARAIQRLHHSNAPDLLLWRNRNVAEVSWGSHLFVRLCKSLMARERTRYFSYRLAEINERDGYVNLDFSGETADVVLRVLPAPAVSHDGHELLVRRGPVALTLVHDTRTPQERRLREHRVEDYVGYVLARNVPEQMTLRFERDDFPAGVLPADLNVDFLHRKVLDDSSFFQMLLASSKDVALVASCDAECLNLFSFLSATVEDWALITPWQVRPRADLSTRFVNVPLSQQALVMGDDSLADSLQGVRTGPHAPDLVIYIDSCVNRLVGDDFRGALAQVRKQPGPPVVHFEIDLKQEPYLAGVTSFMRRLYQAVPQHSTERSPVRVNLLGIAVDQASGLRELLASVGIEVGSCLFPKLSRADVASFNQAELVVRNCWSFVGTMFAGLLEDAEVPVLELPLPFGLEGTLGWLKAIAGRLGRSEDIDPFELPGYAEAHGRIESFRQRFSGTRIALILRAAQWAEQLDPKTRFGWPLVSGLAELGLVLDLRFFAEREVDRPRGETVLEHLGLPRAAGHTVRYFEGWREIPEMLADSDAQLVYTETFRDERITAAGKTPLTMRMFELGFAGAASTAERLQAALELTFYRRWGTYLPDPYRHYLGELESAP